MSNSNRFLKNTVWQVAGNVCRMIVSFLVTIISTRYLGPSNFGVLNYVSSYVTFFTSIIGLGINGVIIHELVVRRDENNTWEKRDGWDENGTVLGTAIMFRLVTGVIGVIAFYGVIYMAQGDDPVTMTVAALQAIQLPFLCLDTLRYWYDSYMESKYPVWVETMASLAASVYKIFLLATGKGVEWFAFATSLDIIVLGVSYLLIYYRQKGPRLRFSGQMAKHLLRLSGMFILANIMGVAYSQMDRIMIREMLGSDELVGLYSAAINTCSLVGFVPISVLNSGRPLVVEAKARSAELFQLRFRQLVAVIMWICIAYSLVATVFSKLIIYILYGEAYLDASVCLQIGVWYTAFSYVGSAMHIWLVCEDKNKYALLFCAMGTAANLFLNFMLIPSWGINGAAFATLVTQVLSNFALPLLFRDTRPYAIHVLKALLLQGIELKSLAAAARRRLGK